MSITLEIATLVVGSTGGGGLAYLFVLSAFGFVYLVLSAYGLYGAIEYQAGPVRAAIVGYLIRAMLTIIGLIAIVVMFDKDGRYESNGVHVMIGLIGIGVIVDKDGRRYENNGETYEIAVDVTALITCGVICK